MNTEMHGKKIAAVYWPDSNDEAGRCLIAGAECGDLHLSATYHGAALLVNLSSLVFAFNDSAGGKDRLCRMAEAVRAKVLGVGRDAENAKTLVVYFDKEPNDYDLRRTHDLLRSNA